MEDMLKWQHMNCTSLMWQLSAKEVTHGSVPLECGRGGFMDLGGRFLLAGLKGRVHLKTYVRGWMDCT